MNGLLAAPLLAPLATTVACLLAWRSARMQRWISVAGALAFLASAVALLGSVWNGRVQAIQAGHWPAPFGITLVADLLSVTMLVLTAVAAVAAVVYSIGAIDRRREAFGFHPLIHVLLLGLAGAFLTGDVFNLFVWFEVTLAASFVLLVLGGEPDQIAGGLKYVALNLVSSALFLSGVGLLYGMAGTLNMADLALKLRGLEGDRVLPVAMFFLVALGIKAALFPLFFWLPASYHTPPVVVAALFAGTLTKLGVYALIRLFTLVFVQDTAFTHGLLLGAAAVSMMTGILAAIAQSDFRRMLSFLVVSHVGYMAMGLALLTPAGLTGAVFYAIHEVIVKTNLFLISGLIFRLRGSYDVSKHGALAESHPGLAVLFLVPALAVAGVPPLSGFIPKLVLVKAALDSASYTVAAVALAVSLLTLYSMAKVWGGIFWGAHGESPPPAPRAVWIPVIALTAMSVLIGLAAGPLHRLSTRAAQQLLDPAAYIEAVLG
jgi:multicomponent Na+:H+ antiporter subunit D